MSEDLYIVLFFFLCILTVNLKKKGGNVDNIKK